MLQAVHQAGVHMDSPLQWLEEAVTAVQSVAVMYRQHAAHLQN